MHGRCPERSKAMKESKAKLTGEMGTVGTRFEGLTLGQNELKEEIQENRDAIKD